MQCTSNPADPQDRLDDLPRRFAHVEKLDALLNQRIIAAVDDTLARRWWQRKVAIKRRLERLPQADVEAAAATLIRETEEAAA